MRSDVHYLASLRVLGAFFANDAELSELEEAYSKFIGRASGYHRVRLLDTSGRELLCVHREHGRQDVAPAAQGTEASEPPDLATVLHLSRGSVAFGTSGLGSTGAADDRPVSPEFRLATAVVDPDGIGLGFLVLEGQGPDLLDRLWALGREFAGQTLLLDETGRVLHRAGDREEIRAAGAAPRPFGDRHPAAWEQIAQSALGQFSNGAGIFTFATVPLDPVRATDGVPEGASALKIVTFVSKAQTLRGIAPAYTRHLRAGLAGLFAVFLLSSYVAYTRGARMDHDRTLAASERRLRELSARLLVAQSRERSRIARDLHDEVGQTGTAVHLHLQRATDVADPRAKDELIKRADVAVEGLLRWAQDMAGQLRAPLLEDLGLGEAVQHLVEEFEAQTGVSATVDVPSDEDSISPAVAEESYRIVQEALTNVTRHARATRVTVRVEIQGESLLLEIEDDGVGFDTSIRPDDGFGIIGMSERVALFRGRLELESAVGEGTTVRVVLPLSGPSEIL
ncbi:MAG: hypothetical protein DRJ42_25830 [Deltaproteobacteria bacterium]|nr:MAG: hypothetical protein DRJ42_25830 [Deltaproteobacteria bacterium]